MPCRGEVVDLIDYDSNLIAVAAGVPDLDRSAAVLKRIDRCVIGGRGLEMSEDR
jgi:hypothetical protein